MMRSWRLKTDPCPWHKGHTWDECPKRCVSYNHRTAKGLRYLLGSSRCCGKALGDTRYCRNHTLKTKKPTL